MPAPRLDCLTALREFADELHELLDTGELLRRAELREKDAEASAEGGLTCAIGI